jgi:hypothetical protein
MPTNYVHKILMPADNHILIHSFSASLETLWGTERFKPILHSVATLKNNGHYR